MYENRVAVPTCREGFMYPVGFTSPEANIREIC